MDLLPPFDEIHPVSNGFTKAPPYKVAAGKTCFMEGTLPAAFGLSKALEKSLDLCPRGRRPSLEHFGGAAASGVQSGTDLLVVLL